MIVHPNTGTPNKLYSYGYVRAHMYMYSMYTECCTESILSTRRLFITKMKFVNV